MIKNISKLDDLRSSNYRRIDDSIVADLMASIIEIGVRDPIQILEVIEEGKSVSYIISGHHRVEAVRRIRECYPHLGDMSIPAIVSKGKLSDLESKELISDAVIKNSMRGDISIFDKAEGYAKLIHAGYSTSSIARMVGKTERHVRQILSVSKIPSDDLKVLRDRHESDSSVIKIAANYHKTKSIAVALKTNNKKSKKHKPSAVLSVLSESLKKHKIHPEVIDEILNDIRNAV